MKKIFVLFISLFLLVLPVYASTNTYSRTTTDLKVPKKIKYKSKKKEKNELQIK